jgi:uncharacterized protein (DUF488 family)
MTIRICTIGYERASFPDFAATLAGAGVTTVIDVRAAPHSRRREFAFKHLGPQLAGYGIGYESWPALGTPEAGRAAAKRGDVASFGRIFEVQLASDAGQAALDALVERMPRETLCLMCYERDPAQCHRTLIVERLRERVDTEVFDLMVGESCG